MTNKLSGITYLAPIPEMLWFGDIVTTELPPRLPAATFILYVRSPWPMIESPDEGDTVNSEEVLTDREYLHWNNIESSENLNEICHIVSYSALTVSAKVTVSAFL